jgi:CelD/BcsL family acetyltransferase involved in cellulose biosynthesis
MNIRAVSIEQITSDEIAAWSAIQRAEAELASPYFRPEFAQAVGAVRKDVEVAVLEENGRAIGFLPYQRSRWNSGRPVGGNLSDYHGLIAPKETRFDPIELLRACVLRSWHFDHLVSGQAAFAPYVWREEDSWHVDVPADIETYFAERENGGRLKSEYGQKRRKLEREVGPIRYVACGGDPKLLSTLMAWKSAQYGRMKVADVFGYAWTRELLHKLLEYDGADFSPIVSALYAGDTIASIHYGLRSRNLLHGWFPAYNLELARYSPGILHWIETIGAAKSAGIDRIDFGEGSESFKRRLKTGTTRVAKGVVDARASAQAVRRAWWGVRDRVRDSSLSRSARGPIRVAFRIKHWLDA